MLPGLSVAMARMASSMEEVGGEAKTLPATPALSIPAPIYPAQKGSWPDPPPWITISVLHSCLLTKDGINPNQIEREEGGLRTYSQPCLAKFSEKVQCYGHNNIALALSPPYVSPPWNQEKLILKTGTPNNTFGTMV